MEAEDAAHSGHREDGDASGPPRVAMDDAAHSGHHQDGDAGGQPRVAMEDPAHSFRREDSDMGGQPSVVVDDLPAAAAVHGPGNAIDGMDDPNPSEGDVHRDESRHDEAASGDAGILGVYCVYFEIHVSFVCFTSIEMNTLHITTNYFPLDCLT